jgi:hypothetical protein
VTSDRISVWEEFFLTSLENLLEEISKQVEIIDNLSDELKSKKRKDYKGSEGVFASLPALLSVPAADLYLAIVRAKQGSREENIKLYNELYKTPHGCKSIIENFRNDFERFRQAYEKIQDEWDRSLRELISFKDSRISEAISQGVETAPAFLAELVQIFDKWHDKNTSDPDVTQEHLIMPLRQLFKDHIGNAESMLQLSLVNEADSNYDDFGIFFILFSEIFGLSSQTLRKLEENARNNLIKARILLPRKRWFDKMEGWFRQWR